MSVHGTMANLSNRAWVKRAIREVHADFQRSAETHMVRLLLPTSPGICLYLKDESTHPSGSLKHRLARSLFLYGLCNGWIRDDTTIIEASSGSTAVSEAYFARLLGLPFVAVMPRSTSQEKIKLIEFYGGRCHFVDSTSQIRAASAELAQQTGGHFMDQFTFAERATDWRGNNNIAESLFRQLELEPDCNPVWVVVGAGTGGTSATLGRFIRYHGHDTQLCVVDPDHSVFFEFYRTGKPPASTTPCTPVQSSRIEGIGRPVVEPSFIPEIIDAMIQVPDRWSVAAMLFMEEWLGRRVGPSTGTNLIGSLEVVHRMRQRSETGSVVTLICDSGDRYGHTFFNEEWRRAHELDSKAELDQIRNCVHAGTGSPGCQTHRRDQAIMS
jgi:cysteine synthase